MTARCDDYTQSMSIVTLCDVSHEYVYTGPLRPLRRFATIGHVATTPALPSGEPSRKLTVTLTPAQVTALAKATFTDTSARPAAEKNAAESAVKTLQAEARRRASGER